MRSDALFTTKYKLGDPNSFPADGWSRVTGDTHLPKDAAPFPYAWLTLHAIVISCIYITRCNVRFSPSDHPTNFNYLVGTTAAAAKTQFISAIQASWYKAKRSPPHGKDKFRERWEHPFSKQAITTRHNKLSIQL